MYPRNAISSSQNKSTASHRCFCLHALSCCLKLSFIWAFWSYMYWQGWIEMGHIFCWKCGSVNFLLLYIWKTWAHLPWKSNGIIVKRTMAQNTWRGMMQGEWMLDKIGIVHWISLPNIPILWTTSVTNCRILSQEICFRGSQYYKCSLSV